MMMMMVQGACVQNILDSLIPALLADKNRKFVYVEQVSFDFLFVQEWKLILISVTDLMDALFNSLSSVDGS